MSEPKQKKKLFNFRLACALALAMVFGILLGAVFAYFAVDGVYILVPIAAGAVILAVTVIATRSVKAAIYFVLCLVFFAYAAFRVYNICLSFMAHRLVCGEEIFIQGKVEKVGITSGGNIYLVLKDCTAGGVKADGKIMAYLSGNAGDFCEKGYTASFFASLRQQDLFAGGQVTNNALSGIKYLCSVRGDLDCDYGFSLFGFVSGAVRRTLYNNVDSETASVCYALLTGETSGIEEGTLQSFRYGGIAHLFAVSGLHIGVIFGALTLLFKMLPINRVVSAIIRIAAIILFAGVCNFTPSSVRATITCSVGVVAELLYEKNDPLSALSFAAFALLVINPMYLFGVGFLLSFGAAIGITMLRYNIARAFSFLHEKIAGAIAVALSAQLCTAPVQFAFFGYISWAGLFLNILVIPLISALYLLLFVLTLISAIIPAVAPILMPFASTPISFFINAVVTLGFENALIVRDFGMWIYAPFVILLCALTDKFNLSPVWRSSLASVAAVCICLGCMF